MSGKFEVFKSEKNNEFYFRLKSGNGQIILQSEGYKTKNNCLKGIASVKKNSQFDACFILHPAHFSLKSKDNGQIIGTSQQYSSESARDIGVAAVKTNASPAQIIDLTKIK